jgi:hypothetical protein
MGVINASSGNTLMLNELAGEKIALRYAGTQPDVISQIPEDDGTLTEDIKDVVRADVVAIRDGDVIPIGATLVYPTIISANLLGRPTDWHAGQLRKEPHQKNPTWAYWVLDGLEPEDLEVLIAGLDKLHLS